MRPPFLSRMSIEQDLAQGRWFLHVCRVFLGKFIICSRCLWI